MTDFPCPPAAIIFDMDGLLVDSERLWKLAETDMLAQRGMTYSEAKHEPFIGMAMGEFIPGIKRVYELNDSVETLHAELIERVSTLIEADTRPQPGAVEMVDFVIQQGLPYGIASSSPLAVIHATIHSQLGWREAFAVRASAAEVERGKPAPDVYLLAAERLGVDPARCLALEDSPNGSRAAVAAGMTCFAVPDATHTRASQFADVTPFVFDSLHDVLERVRDCF